MAHETAHMWTGDLVTCQWWDVTWLNEGMTHFLTYFISGMVKFIMLI
jgi:aminopeptidase N